MLDRHSSTGFDQALVRAGRVDRVINFGEPHAAQVSAALRRICHETDEERIATFCTKLKHVRKGGLSMTSIVDHLFQHTSDYLEKFEDLEAICRDRDALMKDGEVNMFS
jgi:SpoVK/Ycf46/Vps4 family AAA+-type ATPase